MALINRVLLGSLSLSPKTEILYRMDGKTAAASQCPMALVRLLPDERLPDEIILLCTPDLSQKQFPYAKKALEEELAVRKGGDSPPISVKELPIPEGKTPGELWEILHRILEAVPSECTLTLDITHGFRTYPFLYFTAAIFLKALRGVQIEAVYYGMVEIKGDGKPIVDVSLILDMVEWFYAARTFRETGQASHLATLLEPFTKVPPGMEGQICRPYSQVKGIKNALEKVSSAYAQALPLEMGWEAKQLVPRLQGFDISFLKSRIPLAAEIWAQLQDFVRPFMLDHSSGGLNKRELVLDEDELRRQASIIDYYLKQGYVTYALGLIREWIVSASILYNYGKAEGGEPGSNLSIKGPAWISSDTGSNREKMEGCLGALARKKRLYAELSKRSEEAAAMERTDLARAVKEAQARLKGIDLTKESRWLASKWGYMSELRNQVLHHGFRLENVTLNENKSDEIKKVWGELKESIGQKNKWMLRQVGGTRTLLVSPLGLSRGLLFSALTCLEATPSKLWVVTSERAAEALPEVLEKAKWQGTHDVYLMKDAHFGFKEGELLFYSLLPDALEADTVVVNVTGGTTAMQFALQDAAGRLEDLGCNVKLIALIDKRPVKEQQEDPYQRGEIAWLT